MTNLAMVSKAWDKVGQFIFNMHLYRMKSNEPRQTPKDIENYHVMSNPEDSFQGLQQNRMVIFSTHLYMTKSNEPWRTPEAA